MKREAKTLVVTGAAGGIGHAVAARLLSLGCRVIALDVCDSCDLPEYYRVDITKTEEVASLAARLTEEGVRLDGILHIAGMYKMGSLVEMAEADFRQIFDVNFFGVFRINKALLPLLRQGGRVIITTSELAPLWPLPFAGLYGLTKTVLERYAYSLAMELNLLGIKVSVMRPGAVKTPLLDVTLREISALCKSTELYEANMVRFKKITESVEGKHVAPERIAALAERILYARRPRFLYSINRNGGLILLSALPKRLQLFIIKKILEKKG